MRGFTLIEIMVVLAVVAIAAGVVTLSVRDGRSARLEREAERLAMLLETARAEARAAGLPVRWMLTPDAGEHRFRFLGLPASRQMPTRWLDDELKARIADGRAALLLGPEAMIDAQRVQLSLGERTIEVATDGLRPFSVAESSPQRP